jgi:hypothetical protein
MRSSPIAASTVVVARGRGGHERGENEEAHAHSTRERIDL